ncbi:MAG: 4-azaleucine resistance transporter AzlC [Saprospiraceae bacterium]
MKIQSKGHLKLCLDAIVDTMPLAIAVIPWGILTGALAIKIGLTPLYAQLLSLLVFAGAAQLSAMTLISGGASTIAIFGTTFVISARHLLYSIVFREHVMRLPLRWRLMIAFVLTDEMFAVSQAHTKRSGAFSASYAVVSGVTFYVIWNLSTLIGIIAGDSIKNLDQLGLDFAIVATFIAMTFDQLRNKPIGLSIITSGTLAVFLKPIFSDSYIILAAIAGMSVGYLVESLNATSDNHQQAPKR